MTVGRPRKVDRKDALHSILLAFWQNGYKATSMNDLVEASGMAKPGLYSAFGDKEAMFEKALLHYFEVYGPLVFGTMMKAEQHYLLDIRDAIQAIGYLSADPNKPLGCFVFNSQVESAHGREKHKALLADLGKTRLDGIKTRILKAIAAGEISEDEDADSLATYIDGQLAAVSILGRTGANKAQIDAFIEMAMKPLPNRTGFDLDDYAAPTLRQ